MYMRMLQRIINANKKHTQKNVRPDWMNKMKHTFKRMPPFSHQQTHTQKRPRIIDKPKCIRSVCVVYSRGRASMPIKRSSKVQPHRTCACSRMHPTRWPCVICLYSFVSARSAPARSCPYLYKFAYITSHTVIHTYRTALVNAIERCICTQNAYVMHTANVRARTRARREPTAKTRAKIMPLVSMTSAVACAHNIRCGLENASCVFQ